MSADPTRAKSIFLSAVDIASPAERDAYVAAACGSDEALRREVAELLHHQAQAGASVEAPVGGRPSPLERDGLRGLATVDPPITEGPGTVIGPYKLLEQIGEGGFGVVFMAEQQQPVRRRVALKVLK